MQVDIFQNKKVDVYVSKYEHTHTHKYNEKPYYFSMFLIYLSSSSLFETMACDNVIQLLVSLMFELINEKLRVTPIRIMTNV